MLDKFTKNIKKGFTPDERDTPEWVAPVSIVFTVILIIWILVGIIGGTPEPVQLADPNRVIHDQVAQIGGSATPGREVVPPDLTNNIAPSSGAETGSVTAPIATVDGAIVEVAKAAIDTGTSIGLAKFTGNWSNVPIAGITPAPGLMAWPAATVLFIQLEADTDDGYMFLVGIDPDGDGPEQGRTTTVNVINIEGVWTYNN